ncbi:S1C family serine protease [Paenibacillus eucommiae]|uniref:S1-C subfamily serine protease n=1 Tax=Paenibacillus eucommiae TaxID=1355755 RepID=A0ABS4J3R5_9BACL|nr:serine protease [Paenibacillus eucommiae]MBP1993925.1 S1-C subfamily serine protease [Paenibacillus eucommiae]
MSNSEEKERIGRSESSESSELSDPSDPSKLSIEKQNADDIEHYQDEENGREFTEEELEALFQAADEEEEPPAPFFQTPGFRKLLAFVIAVALFVNVAAFFPQVFSLAAIRFLVTSAQLSQSETIKAYKESVVVVRADDRKGTGFVISEDGLIVTNQHVAGNSKEIIVQFPNGMHYSAAVVAIDDEVDLALLDIDATDLPALTLAAESGDAQGVPITVIGNPLFFNGIVNKGETLGILSDRSPPMLAVQAPIYKGNSGSPVINGDGEVIGVIFATSSIRIDDEKKSIGLAVPVEWVWKHLPE